MPIWTPDALRSEAHPFATIAWRLIEAQHRVATLKLVDTLAEQSLLESILEETKPPLPADCAGLDYLLATPFRYRPYPRGSRFRRAGMTPGVWYGAEEVATGVAEMVFYRYLFHAESPETPFPAGAAEHTAISVPVRSDRALDLAAGALARDRAHWMHPSDYTACQQLADAARAAGVGIIRYLSVRDPEHRANLAVLSCRAFGARAPRGRQSWWIRIGETHAQALCEHPRRALEFPRMIPEANMLTPPTPDPAP